MRTYASVMAVVGMAAFGTAAARADVVQFFSPEQTYTQVQSGETWDVIESEGYQFWYTRDKLFTGNTGQVIGRPVTISWPTGVEAQSVSTPGPLTTVTKPTIKLTRADGKPFDVTAFSFKLIANTGGAGGDMEVMGKLNGEDAYNNPLVFGATGMGGNVFSYNETPNYLGQSTLLMKGCDTYTFTLYADYGMVGLTLAGDPVPEAGTLGLLAAGVAGLMMRRRRG